MSQAKATHKFRIVTTLLEVVYGLAWVGVIASVVGYFMLYPQEQAVLLSAATVGAAIFVTTVLILTISIVDTRNILADIYALNIAEAEARIKETNDNEINDEKEFSEETKYDVEISEFPRAA